MVDHLCSDRVQLDVTAHRKQILLRMDHRGFETALPDCPATSISAIDVTNIVPAQPLHHSANTLCAGWRTEQMDMIAHQHETVNRHAVLNARFTKFVEIYDVVTLSEETDLAVVSPLN